MNFEEFKKMIKKLEDDTALFGVNCFDYNQEITGYLKNIDKSGAVIKISIENEAVQIFLPKDQESREKVFIHVLTTCPAPSEVNYSKVKDRLDLTWS